MKPLDMLHKGDFNDMNQEWQPDGSVIITLHKRGDENIYRFRVKDLYGENEQEVDIATGKPIAKGNIRQAMPKVPKKGQRHGKGQAQ